MKKKCENCKHSEVSGTKEPCFTCTENFDYAKWEPKEDDPTKPNHYHKNGMDLFAFGELKLSKEEMKGFYRMNVMKYVLRYDMKNGVEDLEKAEVYLKKLIKLEE